MTANYYNIHNLVSLSVFHPFKKYDYLFKDPRMHFHHFRSAEVADTPFRLSVEVGPFKADKAGAISIDRKYYIKPGYLSFSDCYRRIPYKVEISRLESNNIHIRFDGKIFGLYALFAPNVILNDLIIQPFIEFILGRRNFFLSHSAALEKDGKALIFSGRGGSRKTTISMYLLSKGYKLLGDDYCIMAKNAEVYAYPTHIDVFNYRAARLRQEEMSLYDKWRVKKNFDPRKSVHAPHVCDQAQLNTVYCIYPTTQTSPVISKCAKEHAADFMIKNNLLELMHNPLYFGWLAYALVYPDSLIANHFGRMRKLAGASLQAISTYRADIPANFKPSELYRFLQTKES